MPTTIPPPRLPVRSRRASGPSGKDERFLTFDAVRLLTYQ
jgi:hypothetical protein